ncbi:MAG: hypothetical protein QOE36_1318, partial [Gaiellaceae bacterium]|nr:hypothetical protein [Gaiellaceae bacterium]
GILLAVRGGGPARALGIFLLLYTALNAVHHVEARYGTPLRGLVLAFAALALARLAGRIRPARTSLPA